MTGAAGHAHGMQIRTRLQATGGSTTGFLIPDEVVAQLGPSRRPAVHVTINGHTYRSSIASMGGQFWLGVSAANRAACGVTAGDEVDLGLELDTAPREVVVPADLAAALAPYPDAAAFLADLSYSRRRELVEGIEGAKTVATRERRVASAVQRLRQGR